MTNPALWSPLTTMDKNDIKALILFVIIGSWLITCVYVALHFVIKYW